VCAVNESYFSYQYVILCTTCLRAMGRGFTSGGQESGLCLAQLCTKYRLVALR